MNIGIIGCGIISGIHINAIKKNKNARLFMVCDTDKSRAEAVALKEKCLYTTDSEEMLKVKDIDVIHVLTPHYTHYSIAKSVLLSNKHCLLEKPLTTSIEDAKKLTAISENSKYKLGVVFQNRRNTTSVRIKNIIDNNIYGKLVGIKAYVTWNRDENYYRHDAWRGKWLTEGGGVLINQAIHTLDLIQWFGGEITDISGHYDTYYLKNVIEVEDTALMFMNFRNGAKGMLFATNNNAINTPVEMEIVFENGILIMKDSKLFFKTELLCEDITAEGEKAYWGSSHEIIINEFYDSILNNKKQYISAREAMVTIEILDKFYKYANKLKNIQINY